MTTAISILRRFCGPPGSANGGYACAVAADGLPQPVEVTLHAPPPLETEMCLERTNHEARLVADGRLVASARSVGEQPPVPSPLTYEEALRAAAGFDEAGYADRHPYPGCFTCGPAREAGDGLRIFPAATSRPGTVAWPWTPDASVAGADGAVPLPMVWAALDCPSGLTSFAVDAAPDPMVLGRMTASIHRPVPAGHRLVVAGWSGAADGRKRYAGSGLWTDDGELLASSRTTWLVLTPEQLQAFAART